jgi:hypothetical protein
MKSASSVCIAGYTFRMKVMAWLVIIAALAGIVVALVKLRRRWVEQKRVAESRLASFVAQSMAPTAAQPLPGPPPRAAPPAPVPQDDPRQKLLFDAASKAGEAGEPALAIQLYARLLSRYPDSIFAAQARANVAAQKQRLKG